MPATTGKWVPQRSQADIRLPIMPADSMYVSVYSGPPTDKERQIFVLDVLVTPEELDAEYSKLQLRRRGRDGYVL